MSQDTHRECLKSYPGSAVGVSQHGRATIFSQVCGQRVKPPAGKQIQIPVFPLAQAERNKVMNLTARSVR
jgi:hypothetical protein